VLADRSEAFPARPVIQAALTLHGRISSMNRASQRQPRTYARANRRKGKLKAQNRRRRARALR
jgi:hypothetical protein